MRARPGTAMVVVTWVVFAACGTAGEDRPPGEEPDGRADPGSSVETPAPRPAERSITVEVEGFEESVRFVLYQSPQDFPLAFTTYIPEEMDAETRRRGDAREVSFVAAFGGFRNEAAAVRLIVHGASATEAEAEAQLREFASELGTELVGAPAEEGYDWSIRDFRNVASPFRADAAEGVMSIGRRGDRYFSIAIHYPAEYGDGMGPRVHQILQEWRWEDTGEWLMGVERALNGRAGRAALPGSAAS